MKRLIIACLLIILIVVGTTGLKYFWVINYRKSIDLNYNESTNDIRNPERGWYLIYRCRVNDNSNDGNSFHNNFVDQSKQGDSLVLLMFNLQEYNNGNITEEGLRYIDCVLESVKRTGLKAIVRFVYDWDGYGLENEPQDIQIILNHIEQLQSRFYTYKDVIYLLQGVFVGSYGEMHSSKYLDRDNVVKLMNKLVDSTPESMMISVRTPEYWRLVCGRDKPIENKTRLPEARIGLFNDGLCSSQTDLGTYSDGTGYVTKWPRKEELNFQSQLCRFAPNGGELAVDSKYNDIDNIVQEFPLLHISYLNRDYNMDVLNKWRMSTYQSVKTDDPYDGINGYKYVQDHLGYRFVLRDVSVSKRIFSTCASTIKVKIENTGFANMYYDKDVKVIFKGINTGYETSALIKTDIRSWESGQISKINIPMPRKLKEDTYKIYLEISDQYGDRVIMANPNICDNELGLNAMGEIKVERLTLLNIWKP